MTDITAETGPHPVARRLRAYNAPRSSAKLAQFLQCFDAQNMELRDLATRERKMDAPELAVHYRTIFEHSSALHAQVSKRLLAMNPAVPTGEVSFAVDFEQFSGLVGPAAGKQDGSVSLAPEAAADIVVVYRVVGSADQQVINAMWVGDDVEGVGRVENAPLALVQRAGVWQQVESLIREEYELGNNESLQVQYVKWDDALSGKSRAQSLRGVQPKGLDESCWLCNKSGEVLSGCKCGRHAHVDCLADAAKSNRHLWLQCPGCQQEWTGKLGLGLAKKRFELADHLEHGAEGALDEKLGSALDLMHALNENTEYTDAINLGRQTLATFRKVAQSDDPNLLHCLGMLAHGYMHAGRYSEALPLLTEQLETLRSQPGPGAADNPRMLGAAHDLATLHTQMQNYHLALPLMGEVMSASRRIRGDDDSMTLSVVTEMAELYSDLGQYAKALPLCVKVADSRTRLLGITHEKTVESLANVGTVQMRLGEHVQAGKTFSKALAAATDGNCFKGKPKTLRDACVQQLSELASKNAAMQTDPVAASEYQKQLLAASTNAAHMAKANAAGTLSESQRKARATKLTAPVVVPVPEEPPIFATVFGVTARPELNGVQVQLVGYVADKGRYTVRELETATVATAEKRNKKPLSLRAASLQLAIGTIVETLNCGPLSGQRGVVVGWDATEMALQVQLEGVCESSVTQPDTPGDEKGILSLECENCRAVAAGQQIDVAAASAMLSK